MRQSIKYSTILKFGRIAIEISEEWKTFLVRICQVFYEVFIYMYTNYRIFDPTSNDISNFCRISLIIMRKHFLMNNHIRKLVPSLKRIHKQNLNTSLLEGAKKFGQSVDGNEFLSYSKIPFRISGTISK